MSKVQKLTNFQLKKKLQDIRGTNALAPQKRKWSIFKILRNLSLIIDLIIEALDRLMLEEE